MPPGEVSEPNSNDNALKTGYLLRYDLLDDEGQPSKIPVLNAQDLEKRQAVVFDVFQFQIVLDSQSFFIPVAVIPDDLVKFIMNKDNTQLLKITENWEAIKKKIKWDEQWGGALEIGKDYEINDIEEVKSGKKMIIDRKKKVKG